MIPSPFSRQIKVIIMGIVCSLPIYLRYLTTITDNNILLLSFIAFVIALCIDTIRFSYYFWEKQYYLLGQVFPLVIYAVLGVLTCLLFPPKVFNRIFLPLRFVGSLGLTTIESIPVVLLMFLGIVTLLRFFVSKKGRTFSNYYGEKNEDE